LGDTTSTITLRPNEKIIIALWFEAEKKVDAGVYNITIRGISETLMHSKTILLNIIERPRNNGLYRVKASVFDSNIQDFTYFLFMTN
jgi:hypothetical protein